VGDPKRFAPIFPVRDLGRAIAYYRRLGFATREYDGGGYGFAVLDGAELHLGVVAHRATPGSAYLFVDDADGLARTWASVGAEVRAPQDTEWGRHEGAMIDPDGNVVRFGSPMGDRRSGRDGSDVGTSPDAGRA
jgi:catechol 2,3-dioxygenase-like lactoylglutathione lyase family enzyme